jgi:outer membrane lipoprotein-sorting protein
MYNFIVLLIVIIPIFATAELQKDILKKIDEIRAPDKTFIFDLKITYKKKNGKDIIQKLKVHVKDGNKSLVKFTYPPTTKGRLLLMVGNNMWIYIPNTRKPIRISPQQRLLGQVANGDVARVVYSVDYNSKILGIEKINNKICLRLELSAKNNQVTYSKIILWVEKTTYKPIKAKFYAISGKLLKTAYYKGYTYTLGKERPLILEVHDELRKGEVSIMEYSNLKVADTPKAYFQKSYLKHIR